MADRPAQPRVVYTVPEAADILRMGKSTLYRLVKAKQVPHGVMPGTGIRYLTQKHIDEILELGDRPAVA